MRWFRRLRKPSPTGADIERADQWLRKEFQRETERIEREMPEDLLDRCLRVARTETEPQTAVPGWRTAVAWAGVVVLSVALAGVLIWQMREVGSPSSRSVANRETPPTQPQDRPTGHARTMTQAHSNRSNDSQPLAANNSGVIVRRPHTNLPVANRSPAVQDREHRLSAEPRVAHPSESLTARSTSINDAGEAVTTVPMEPVSPHESVTGTVQLVSASESGEVLTRITLEASGLVPDKSYQMFVQVTDSADPVFIAAGKSDTNGLLVIVEHIAAVPPARRQPTETDPAPATQPGPTVTNASPSTPVAVAPSQPSGPHPTVAAVDHSVIASFSGEMLVSTTVILMRDGVPVLSSAVVEPESNP